VSTFVLRVGPLPVRSTAVHRDASDRGFTDVQASGPVAAWAHSHTFTPLSDGRTRIDEHIEYAHKPGLWGVATRSLFSKPNLWLMFSYRWFVIRWFLRRRSVLR
jgi:ligand-binding SRPBCC domain-containing protein